jgi:putative oxidoreductase
MPNFPFISAKIAIVLLRVVPGLIMTAHGIARMYLGTINEFGNYLNSEGFMIGTVIAWTLTIIEIIGGLALAAGFFVKTICAWFVLQHLFGIILVHAPNGWFTVGAQSGGMEYSFLLLVCFICIAALHKKSP